MLACNLQTCINMALVYHEPFDASALRNTERMYSDILDYKRDTIRNFLYWIVYIGIVHTDNLKILILTTCKVSHQCEFSRALLVFFYMKKVLHNLICRTSKFFFPLLSIRYSKHSWWCLCIYSRLYYITL